LEEVLKFRPHSGGNLTRKSVAGYDKSLEVLAVSEVVGDVAGECVFREVEVLEAREATEGERDGAGEVVAVEEEAVECGSVGELRREDAGEGVVVEVESAEEAQRAEL